MSTPLPPAAKTFFTQGSEAQATLRQACIDLPAPPVIPIMRSRSASAPDSSSRRDRKGASNVMSFFTGSHVLLADAETVSKSNDLASDDGSKDDTALLEARMYALLIQVHGKIILDQLSSRRKGLVLVTAARLGYSEAVRLLLKSDAELDVFDGFGENAMLAAAGAGQLKILSRLLKAGCSLEYLSPAGQSGDAVTYAIQRGQMHAAAMMALHYNIRLSQVVAGHVLRHCKGESPVSIATDD